MKVIQKIISLSQNEDMGKIFFLWQHTVIFSIKLEKVIQNSALIFVLGEALNFLKYLWMIKNRSDIESTKRDTWFEFAPCVRVCVWGGEDFIFIYLINIVYA